MTQKFDIGLNAKINEFTKKFSINRTDINDDDVFEDFGKTKVGKEKTNSKSDNKNLNQKY